MSKKTESTPVNDFSAVFDIDNDSLPKELIEKDPDASSRNLGFLSGNDEDGISAKEKEEKAKEKSRAEKAKKADKAKNRTIIILLATVLLFIGATVISLIVNESRKPVITPEKPVVQTISRYTENTAVTIAAGNTMRIFFIDNDYDVHYIENGQTVELYDEAGTMYKGTITEIRESSPESGYIKNYAELLTGVAPSTSVYTVFITPANPSDFSKEGIILRAKTLTKTATDALTINASAVFIDGNQSYVWLYSPLKKTLTRQDVKTGLTVDGITQITAGLEKSDKVATSFSCSEEKIYDGIKVKID